MLLTRVRVETEHHCAYFYCAHAGFDIELDREGLPRIVQWFDVWQETAGIEVDGVSAGRCHYRYTRVHETLDDIAG